MKCKSNYLKSPLASLSSSAISLSYWPYSGLLSSQGRTHICLGLLRLLSSRMLSSSARRASITASSLLLRPISLALNSATRPTRSLWGGIIAIFSAEVDATLQGEIQMNCPFPKHIYPGGKKLKEKTLADIVSDPLRSPPMQSEANPTILRQNRVKILEKIADNVTAPLLLRLLLRLFKDSLFSTTTPDQN